MQCKHCGDAFFKNTIDNPIDFVGTPNKDKWRAETQLCPSCRGQHITLVRYHYMPGDGGKRDLETLPVYPRGGRRPVDAKSVPVDLLQDYEEACLVIETSPKASAALSRRCLQTILRKQGYEKYNLADQIDDLLSESDPKKALAPSLDDVVDAVRNFGNFATHQITSETTLQVIDVEEGEAETCLLIIEELFDHYFEKPAKLRSKIYPLNKKLKDAGKKASKTRKSPT